MRRILLSPPLAATEWPGGEADGCGAAVLAPPLRGALDAPLAPRERARPLFHPKRGWIRRLERGAGHFLERHVYARLPGIDRPYGRLLRRELTLSEATIDLPGRAMGFDGTRLLLITDIHAGPFVSRTVLRQTFERLLALEPDLILLGGDLVTSRLAELDEHREAFGLLRAPLGVFAVLGNHDHYTGEVERLCEEVGKLGIQLLLNRSVVLHKGGSSLGLAGIDDLLMGNPDLPAALRGASSPLILLSHSPDILFEAARAGIALVLSGHTHAGQIRVPGLPVLVRQSRYGLDEGRYRVEGTELVVSRGLGASGVPWRIACAPEAILLRLRC